MRFSKRSPTALLLPLLIAIGCSGGSAERSASAPPSSEPSRAGVELLGQQIGFELPGGWRARDAGEAIVVERSNEDWDRVELRGVGVALPSAHIPALERARAAVEAGSVEEAYSQLVRVRFFEQSFPDEEQRRTCDRINRRAQGLVRSGKLDEALADIDGLIATLEALPDPELDRFDRWLEVARGHEIVSTKREGSGPVGLFVVEAEDPATGKGRQRYALILLHGDLLAARTNGDFELTGPVLDSILGSIERLPAAG